MATLSRKKYLEMCCDNYADQVKRLTLENQVLRNFVNNIGKEYPEIYEKYRITCQGEEEV